MPIPAITNDPPNADNKPFSYKLLKAATIQMHAKGLVAVVATPAIMNDLRNLADRNNATRDQRVADRIAVINGWGHSASATRRKTNATKRLAYANLLRDRIFAVQPRPAAGVEHPNLNNSLCNTTFTDKYFMESLTSNDDVRIYLALHYSTKREQEVSRPRARERQYTRNRYEQLQPNEGFRYRIAALIAWKTQPLTQLVVEEDYPDLQIDEDEPVDGFINTKIESFTILEGSGPRNGHGIATAPAANHHENDALMTAHDDGNMAFLDLACGNTANNTNNDAVYVEGAGRDMVLFTLAKIAQVKRRRVQRYTSVLAYMSHTNSNPPLYPLEKIMKDCGFRRVDVSVERVDDAPGQMISPERYYVLCDTYNAAGNITEEWTDRLAGLFPTPDTLCALDTSATRPQCI